MERFYTFFGKWFSAEGLCIALKKNGFMKKKILKSDRIRHCPLPPNKELEKNGREIHAHQKVANSEMTITKCFDKKCVHIISNYCDPEK